MLCAVNSLCLRCSARALPPAQARRAKLNPKPKKFASADKDLTGFPLLHALQQREELVRNGKLTTIIYIRHKNSKGQEVSGYIDYAHRLKSENFEPYFERKKRLMPHTSDLSFYNWETQTATSNPTPNFQIIADNEAGLLFKNKRDRKVLHSAIPVTVPHQYFLWLLHIRCISSGCSLSLRACCWQVINVDPMEYPGDNSRRVEVPTPEYLQVVLWDHVTRRKN